MSLARLMVILAAATMTVEPARAAEPVDLATIHRIRQEALTSSKVMEHLFMLADVFGPRLTGSPGFRAAGDWAVEQLSSWGLKNAHREVWGPFGRSWSCSYFSAHLIKPQYAPLIGVALAWSGGAAASIDGEPLYAPMPAGGGDEARARADWEGYVHRWKGKLRGRIVLVSRPRELDLPTTAPTARFSEPELAKEALATEMPTISPVALPTLSAHPPPLARIRDASSIRAQILERDRVLGELNRFFHDEGVAALIMTGSGNFVPGWADGGTVVAFAGGTGDPAAPPAPPIAALTPEHYNRIVRLLEHKIPTRLHLDVHTQTHDDPQSVFNVIAEIPGTDT